MRCVRPILITSWNSISLARSAVSSLVMPEWVHGMRTWSGWRTHAGELAGVCVAANHVPVSVVSCTDVATAMCMAVGNESLELCEYSARDGVATQAAGHRGAGGRGTVPVSGRVRTMPRLTWSFG